MTTYNNVITSFREVCSKHKQINTFFSGEEWDFQSQENIYPAVLLSPIPSTMEYGRVMLKFNMFVVDLLTRDALNNDEIKSDTLQIGQDIISHFFDNFDVYGFTIEEQISLTPLNEEMDDIVSGWVFDLTIQIPYSMNDCFLPIN